VANHRSWELLCGSQGCFQPSLDGTDRCITCGAWYDLSPDGQCRARYMWATWTGLCLVGALACVLIAYVVDLNLRASVNPSGLACGLASRSIQKYRSGPQRDLWPLTTNLCTTPVGGPGLLLYFNFLAAAAWSQAGEVEAGLVPLSLGMLRTASAHASKRS